MRQKLRGSQPLPACQLANPALRFSYWYLGLSCFNLFWIIFAMVSIEVTLNLNHMNNVLGTLGLIGAGQLIPLAIGLISLVRVLYMILRERVLSKRLHKNEKSPGSGTTHESPAASHTCTEGLGFGPSTAFESASSPLPPPPPLPATTAAHHTKRSLPHRILLAWLPWLGIFEWSRHSLSPSMGRYSKLGRAGHQKKDSGVSFSGPSRSTTYNGQSWKGGQNSENSRYRLAESPSAALLGSPPPQLAPDQRGLMASKDDIDIDIELPTRYHSLQSASDIGMYAGRGYDEYYGGP